VKINDRRRFDPEGNPKGADEAVAEPSAAEPPPVAAPNAELEAARRRVDELARAYQSLTQEQQEFKARLTRERERMLDVDRAEVAQVLLDVADELDLALKSAADSPLAHGVRLIRDGILQKLQSSGVERLQVIGARFDPSVAEANDMEVTTDPDQDQKVTAEVRAGYRLKDRVIRPARVRVARYVPPASA
jgi:molecular chaperone GrpE